MKKSSFLLIAFLLVTTLPAIMPNSVKAPEAEYIPTIESCDGVGIPKDAFWLNHYVYVKGSDFDEFESYDLYVVEDVTWVDNMTIPTRVPGTPTSVASLGEGIILATSLGQLDPGKYDILVDFNGNGKFDEGIDPLDDNDIEVTAGFFVVPEFWLGTILGLGGCFAALGVFLTFKRKNN